MTGGCSTRLSADVGIPLWKVVPHSWIADLYGIVWYVVVYWVWYGNLYTEYIRS